MKNLILIHLVAGGLLLGLGTSAAGQETAGSPFTAFFADTSFASTYNGQPLVVGSIVQACDSNGVYLGEDTVVLEGTFGYFPVEGDDPNSSDIDEGAEDGELIRFRINGHPATVVAGDATWENGEIKSVTLAGPASVSIVIHPVSFPADTQVIPGDTVRFRVDVKNGGDGTDFYSVKLSMSLPDSSSPDYWEALEPDSAVYADPDETVSVYFDIRVPVWNPDTANVISYSVFSHLDTTVSVDSSVRIYRTVTDVDDPVTTLPDGFALLQNYPNPFNPTTTICFVLPSRSEARLEVFNVLGRTVEIRNLGVLSDGRHEIEYDASSLASGVYFYRLVTDYAAESRKMILLK